MIVGVLGVLLAVFAARSSFALLLQGQAYRWIWPLDLLRYALAVAVAALGPGPGLESAATIVESLARRVA